MMLKKDSDMNAVQFASELGGLNENNRYQL